MLLKENIPWTYVVGKVRYELVAVTCYATAFGLWHEDLNLHHVTIPLAIPGIIGTIISLLLAFRSNQAYDRWWEARIIWGAIVNDSRTLIRQMLSFMNDPGYSVNASTFIERFTRRQIFFNHALGKSLRGQDPLYRANEYLQPHEVKFAAASKNLPNALIQLHGMDLKHALDEGWVNPFQQVEIDGTLTRLCDSMGKCERIKKTVFPTTYSLYINFALYLFIAILPFGLTEYLGVVLVPMVILISVAFLFIDKMATHLQDPFENTPTDTPMTAIATSIERDLLDMVREHTSAREHVISPEGRKEFYLL